MAKIEKMKLGSQGLEVSRQGLGCMGMSAFYGPPKPESDMIDLIHHAIDTGITFLDTSDVYGPFTNEILLGKALKHIRNKVELATKFGVHFGDGKRSIRGDPAFVRAACEASLKRLQVDCIDLYYQHRVDTGVPIEVTIGEMKKLVEEGRIKYIGLSEASASTIRRAHAVHPITAVQLEWSLWTRDVEEEIVPVCRELGIGIVAYSPLGRGFLSSGTKLVENLSEGDSRKHLPRFQPENLEHNELIFDLVNEIALKKGCTPSQLALAWVHHQGNDVCPIPGTTKIENLNQNIGALSVKLSPEEMAELEGLASEDAVKGERYGTGVDIIKSSRRNASLDLKSITTCNNCKPATISSETEICNKIGKNLISSTAPPSDSHSSVQSHSKNKGPLLSRLFPRLRKKNKSEASPNRVESEAASQTFKDMGIMSMESLKKELMEANESRDAALMEVS
ncbi:hypothetical protein IFM89_029187 [Coptis chinensis]|uniref:NADP-dependent oxidoreductase domain-containing protein n=1 Tax=Coptis chinensis TaxID=261450 RepID=A0A835MA17_9MAGN|nr:hypothetical protein IFM89_029187 [Coptis chinensis]